MKLSNVLKIIFWLSFFLFSIDSLFYPFNKVESHDKYYLNPTFSIIKNELKMRGIELDKPRIELSSSLRGPFNQKVAGLTVKLGSFYSFILLDREYFMAQDNEIREAVLLHEIGHYLGVKKHDDEMLEKQGVWNVVGCPRSIMHSSHDLRYCFWSMKNYYYNELVEKILDTKE